MQATEWRVANEPWKAAWKHGGAARARARMPRARWSTPLLVHDGEKMAEGEKKNTTTRAWRAKSHAAEQPWATSSHAGARARAPSSPRRVEKSGTGHGEGSGRAVQWTRGPHAAAHTLSPGLRVVNVSKRPGRVGVVDVVYDAAAGKYGVRWDDRPELVNMTWGKHVQVLTKDGRATSPPPCPCGSDGSATNTTASDRHSSTITNTTLATDNPASTDTKERGVVTVTKTGRVWCGYIQPLRVGAPRHFWTYRHVVQKRRLWKGDIVRFVSRHGTERGQMVAQHIEHVPFSGVVLSVDAAGNGWVRVPAERALAQFRKDDLEQTLDVRAGDTVSLVLNRAMDGSYTAFRLIRCAM